MLFPLSLPGVLSHMTVLRMLLLSAEPAMEPPGDLGAFEGRRGLGEHGGLGRGVEDWVGEGRKTLKKKKRKKPSAFFLQHSGKRMFHRGLERRNFFTSKWIAISLHLAPEGN